MNETFAIEPYVSVGPMRYGMSENDVRKLLGEPISIDTSRQRPGERSMRYDNIRVGLDVEGVAEVSITPPTIVTLQRYDLFADKNAWRDLCVSDGAPGEVVGFLVLKKFGVALTGFHDGDDSQLAVTAFQRGRWDSFVTKPISAQNMVI